MSNFDETILKRVKALEREVERLKVKESPIMSNYLLTTGKAADSDKLDGVDSTGFATAGHDHSGVYLPVSGKAADSDKLDNIDSTGFVQTSGDQTVAGVKTFSSIPVLPSSDPTTSNQAVRKGYADAAYLGKTAKAADADKLDGLDSTAFRTANSVKLSHLTINDDVAVSFTPTNANGFLLVRKLAGATFAIVAYDAVSPTAYAVNMGSSSDVNVTTGALTGTTGTDGKLTVSAHTDGKIYIENRLGATVYIGYVAL